jgi:tryptophan 2,3-dioxygenase
MDFLDFRDKLRPASGFQSWQFKALEARLGLKYRHRYGQQYYISQLRQPEIDIIKKAEKDKSLLESVNDWLERMPFFAEPENWKNFDSSAGAAADRMAASGFPPAHIFWAEYRQRYQQSLADTEKANLGSFDAVFHPAPGATNEDRSLSPAACRSVLFIMLYRGYPILQLPFQLLNQLLEIDEQLSTWRYRHMGMVHRMIGTRIGTGGSTGRDYLKSALDSHYIFKEIARLTSFLIERRKLPRLSTDMERRLGFTA